ncbi:transposase [Streptomyces sp. NBC_01481]|uniref:IS701 family transposase n=1 Tax=Streptomyces sp. NBC_01481 TaxID=2975869 RepID=UPI00225290A3|nr:transposase [Streptomyces sp. NBC_01481]MCX4582306.1 transposase [Streptomyces sp. NBC_01481]
MGTLSMVAPEPARTVVGSAANRPALDAFVAEIFERLPRADQRKWAHIYTRGLLVTPGRKTVRRLAASVSDSTTAAQALHQFVNASPWDWAPVRARLADWVVRRSRPRALVLGPAVLPKRGDRSCGVHRRFVPQDGRTVNCQVGVGAFLATDDATVPVDWRLLLPGAWSEDPEVRGRARVPETASGAQDSAEAQALDLVDEVGRGLPDPDLHGVPVVADLVGFADSGALVCGLVARRRRFVVAVPGDLVVLPDRVVGGVAGRVVFGAYGRAASGAAGRTASGTSGARARAVTARNLLAAHHGRSPLHPPAAAEPDLALAPGPAAVATGVVRLPGIPVALRLVCERWGEGGGASGDGVRVWLTDLVDRPAPEVLALARLHTEAVDTVERLAEDFGLHAFEGRSYPGWHHHMTLVSAAFAYGTLGSATAPPGNPAPASRGPMAGRPPRGARSGAAPTRSAGAPGRGSTAPSRASTASTRPPAVPTRFPSASTRPPLPSTAPTQPSVSPARHSAPPALHSAPPLFPPPPAPPPSRTPTSPTRTGCS